MPAFFSEGEVTPIEMPHNSSDPKAHVAFFSSAWSGLRILGSYDWGLQVCRQLHQKQDCKSHNFLQPETPRPEKREKTLTFLNHKHCFWSAVPWSGILNLVWDCVLFLIVTIEGFYLNIPGRTEGDQTQGDLIWGLAEATALLFRLVSWRGLELQLRFEWIATQELIQ